MKDLFTDIEKDNNLRKKAILLVSFGTSYNTTRSNTITCIEKDIRKSYPEYEVRRAFTSQIIIDKLKQRDNLEIDNIYQATQKLIIDKFDTVICQPTHIINGYEYDDIISEMNIYKDKFKNLVFGTPLLTSTKDYKNIVNVIVKEFSNLKPRQALVLIGHGTNHFSNSAYAALDYQFKDNGNTNIFVGTVENYPDFNSLLKQIKKFNPEKIYLAPLMVVCGDHAVNDIAGNRNNSWKVNFINEGFEVEVVLKGLGEYESIRKIYIDKIANMINSI